MVILVSSIPEPSDKVLTPVAVVGGKLDSSIDIWNFGCYVFEFVIGTRIFMDMQHHHFLEMSNNIKLLPARIIDS